MLQTYKYLQHNLVHSSRCVEGWDAGAVDGSPGVDDGGIRGACPKIKSIIRLTLILRMDATWRCKSWRHHTWWRHTTWNCYFTLKNVLGMVLEAYRGIWAEASFLEASCLASQLLSSCIELFWTHSPGGRILGGNIPGGIPAGGAIGISTQGNEKNESVISEVV